MAKSPKLTDKQLHKLLNTKTGKEEAWRIIQARIMPGILCLLNKYHCANAVKHNHEDFVQQCLRRVYVNLTTGNYDPSLSGIKSFSYRVSKNEICTQLKFYKQKRHDIDKTKHVMDEFVPHDNTPEPDQESILLLLDKVKPMLSFQEWEVFLSYCEGYLDFAQQDIYRTIGDKMNLSPKQVDNTLSRAKRKIFKNIPNCERYFS